MANEASISVSETGSVLSAFTFLLGLSFVIPEFSEPLRVMLLLATIITAGALAIFANSSGALARIRDNSFERHMRWANVLLEFGGLYPLAIVLPAVFAHAGDSLATSLIVGAAVAGLIAAYEYSPFSLGNRYRRLWQLQVARILTIALPAAYSPLYVRTGDETIWLACVALVLVTRSALYLIDKSAENRFDSPRRRLFSPRGLPIVMRPIPSTDSVELSDEESKRPRPSDSTASLTPK